jgi:tRNA (adenine37-N6)-methyltransferase
MFTFEAIGSIRSPHLRAEEAPIQPTFARGIRGRVVLRPEFEPALADLEGFTHLHLIYVFDRARSAELSVVPFLGDAPRGVFSTRAPNRPNPIGLSLVRLVGREGCVLHIEDVDVLDGTPLLDIKPYVPRFDVRDDARGGWHDEVDDGTARERGRRGYPGAPEESR